MKIKKYLPVKLFNRFVLIIILPVLIIQLISTYIFYQTHLQNVVKRISSNTIKKILFINKNFEIDTSYNDIDIKVHFYKDRIINKKDIIKNKDKYIFFDQKYFFIDTLLNNINNPIAIKENDNEFIILIQKDNGILSMTVNKKELIVKTARIFITWNIALSFITLFVAIVFMKNQIRPIKLLKKHVKNFSLNQNISKLKPTGAQEIRDLTLSFLEMEKRILKFINQRTIMLAGISHDLRTPLTRMKLELEMADTSLKTYLNDDINYMENIINQYLGFIKNTTIEDKSATNIYEYMNTFIKEYKKINKNIHLKCENIDKNELVMIQQLSFKRAIQNIVDNSFKFGTKTIIKLNKTNNNKIKISIEDNGGGVDNDYLEKLAEPFFKIDKSRNSNKASIGLGLAIAKDIILYQNGTIDFTNLKNSKGLKVQITLNINYI